ncbi:MAG: hypothetical protein P8P66_07580 [Paracoccaceae bacterium]|nr:hypothetical protein [Paracoccaceae bacterium]
MRIPLILLTLLCGCSNEANHLGNPLLWPVHAVSHAASETAYQSRRGAVELFVKSNHPTLVSDIRAGGGATLTEAMNRAEVPTGNRAGLVLDLQSDLPLYSNSPDAMIVTLMVYS